MMICIRTTCCVGFIPVWSRSHGAGSSQGEINMPATKLPTGFARSVDWKIMSNELNMWKIRLPRLLNLQQRYYYWLQNKCQTFNILNTSKGHFWNQILHSVNYTLHGKSKESVETKWSFFKAVWLALHVLLNTTSFSYLSILPHSL